MVALNTAAVRTGLEGDAEFRLAARFWDAVIQIDMGEHPYTLAVEGGAVTQFDAGAPAAPTLRIRGPEDGWQEFLKPVPRPFYQDLNAAVFRHGFAVEGEVVDWGPYYTALRRLWEVIRQTGQEG